MRLDVAVGLASAAVLPRPSAATAPFGGHATLLDSLVSYWKLEETSGTRVDVVSGNDLESINAVGSTVGVRGTAANFVRASSMRLRCASNPTLQTGEIDFCMAGWCYLTSAVLGVDRSVMSKGSEWYVDFGGTGVMEAQTMHLDAINGDTAVYDIWNWVYFQYRPALSQIAIQLNAGSLLTAPAANNIVVDNGDLEVGAFFNGAGLMDGALDELGFWKGRVLTAQERSDLYNDGAGLFY